MKHLFFFLVGWFLMLTLPSRALSQQDYPNHRQLSERLNQLARSHPQLAKLESLTKTAGGKDIWLLSVGAGELSRRPALAVVGTVSGDHLLGSELALQFAEKLLTQAATMPAVRELLDSVTFYIFPDMSPDAREQYFAALRYERLGNANPSDLDRDGRVGEDPYNDLNGDGLITMMRIKDPTGQWMTHPDDERIMVRAQPEKGERGQYLVFSEGIDNDQDGQFNEDGEEGVFFNRNFTFKYPAFTRGAGEHAVSERETRAIADFLFDARNVYAVITFGPANNLSEPLRHNEREAAGRIPTAWHEADIRVNQLASLAYNRHIETGKAAAGSDGDLFQWAYFHYGRFSFSSPGWWVPANTSKARGEGSDDDKAGASPGRGNAAQQPGATSAGTATTPTPPATTAESRPAMRRPGGMPGAQASSQQGNTPGQSDAELAFLKWAEAEGLDEVFVPWTPVNHPGFPGREVEVGGIKPHLMKNPPYKLVDSLAEKHMAFILDLAAMRPVIDLVLVKTETLGNNLFRITAEVINKGDLPTISAHGQRVRWVPKTVIRTSPSQNQEIISGKQVEVIDSIDGHSRTERSWLIRGKGRITITAGAENIGFNKITVTL